MKKIILIVVGVVVIVVGVFLWLYSQNSSGPSQVGDGSTTSTLPIAASGTVPLPISAEGDTITIGTPKGVVTINNFHKAVIAQDEEYVTFAETSIYKLLYDTDHSSFVVSVSAGPLVTTRPAAEGAFLNALGISQADACKLAVTVGIEPSVDPAFAHQALPLSFCN